MIQSVFDGFSNIYFLLKKYIFQYSQFFKSKLQRKATFCLMSLKLRTALNIHGQLFNRTHEPVFKQLFTIFKMA